MNRRGFLGMLAAAAAARVAPGAPFAARVPIRTPDADLLPQVWVAYFQRLATTSYQQAFDRELQRHLFYRSLTLGAEPGVVSLDPTALARRGAVRALRRLPHVELAAVAANEDVERDAD